MKNTIFLLVTLFTLSIFTSCASAKVHLDQDSEYKKETLKYSQELFSTERHISNWWNCYLEAEKMKSSSKKWKSLGLENENYKEAYAGTFIRDSRKVFTTALVRVKGKDFLIISGKNKSKIPFSFSDTMISYSGEEVKGGLMILKMKNYDIGKTRYTLQSDMPAGLRVMVGGKEYAVVDMCSSPSYVYMNTDFSAQGNTLSQEEKDFIHSVIFAVYDACQTFTAEGKKNNTLTSLQK